MAFRRTTCWERGARGSQGDAELAEYLEELKNRPDKRMLFSVTKNATKAQIEAIVRMIEERCSRANELCVEGVDYWVRLVEFPSMASPAVTVSNGDGTFTIYKHALRPGEADGGPAPRAAAYRGREHFYRDEYGVCELEAAANGLLTLSEPQAPEPAPGRGASGSTGTPAPCWRTSCAGPRPRAVEQLLRAGLEL